MNSNSTTVPTETIRKAFEAVDVADGEVEIRLVSEADYGAVLTFMEEHYQPDEPVSKAIGLEWNAEIYQLFLTVLEENLSLMAVDRTSRDVVGMRFIKIGVEGHTLDTSTVTHPRLKLLMEIINDMLAMGDFFNRFNVKKTIDFFGLAVNRNYRNMGIASRLMKAAVSFGRAVGREIGVTYLRGEGSSNFSKKVYENLGFELILELPYTEYKLNGETVIQNTGEHKSYRAYAKRIE